MVAEKNRRLRKGDQLIIIILILGLIISAGVYWWAGRPQGGLQAVVTVDGKEFRRINLDQVKAPFEFTVQTGAQNEQYNIIEIERTRVRVREANCPEQVDVNQGWLTRPGQSAVCLPHRVVLRLVSTSGQDEVDEIVR